MKTIATKNIAQLKIASKINFYILILMLYSCDSFVEVDLPKSQLTNTAVFQNYTTANAAMADIYAKIRDKGLLTGTVSGISNQLGYYTDELTFYGTSTNPAFAFYSNSVLPSNTTVSTMWNNTYNQIYAVNSVLEGIAVSDFSTIEKAQLQGEAFGLGSFLQLFIKNSIGITISNLKDFLISHFVNVKLYVGMRSTMLAGNILWLGVSWVLVIQMYKSELSSTIYFKLSLKPQLSQTVLSAGKWAIYYFCILRVFFLSTF